MHLGPQPHASRAGSSFIFSWLPFYPSTATHQLEDLVKALSLPFFFSIEEAAHTPLLIKSWDSTRGPFAKLVPGAFRLPFR